MSALQRGAGILFSAFLRDAKRTFKHRTIWKSKNLTEGGRQMVDNTTTIQAFLNIFAAPIAPANAATAVTGVLALFSPDAGNPVTSPTVGIGGNTQSLGPSFTGNAAITALFTELLSSFPSLTFMAFPAPANPAFCVAQGNTNLIVIQAQLQTGPHMAQWFPPNAGAKRSYYSKPLSDLVPAGQNENAKKSIVPVCAAFTFDPANPIAPNQYKILNLAFYLDRWQFAADLWMHGHYPFPHPN
jgi:hypothetical protein